MVAWSADRVSGVTASGQVPDEVGMLPAAGELLEATLKVSVTVCVLVSTLVVVRVMTLVRAAPLKTFQWNCRLYVLVPDTNWVSGADDRFQWYTDPGAA